MTPKEAVDHLMGKHALSHEQACGVIGALMALPSLRPFSPPNNLRADRYSLLWDWASANGGRNPNELATQLDFLVGQEFSNGYARLGSRLASAVTPGEGVYAVSLYLYPTLASVKSHDNYPERLRAAEALLTEMDDGKRNQET